MKKNASRLLAILMVLVLSVSLVACGGNDTEEPAPNGDVSTTTSTTIGEQDATAPTDEAGDADPTEPADPSDDQPADPSDTTAVKDPAASTQDNGTTISTGNGMDKNTTTADKVNPTTKKPTTGDKVNNTTKPTTTTTTRKGKPVITVTGPTTTKTTAEATTTKFVPKNPLRVLSIGHSFSKDAMEAYLWDLLNESGEYDYIVVAYLFYPGCRLDRQWYNINGVDDKGSQKDKDGVYYEYQQYRKTDPYSGAWSNQYKGDFKNLAHKAIQDEDWDIITLQPSPDYGAGPEKCGGEDDYDHVNDLVSWINSKKTNPQAKVYYHMTWSFAEDCRLWSFMYSNYDQVQMYKDFVAATRKYVISTGKFGGLIPAGTSIQNARSSRLGDVFNMPGEYDPKKDGYHLNDRGDYVAALTWYSVLTGKSAKTAWCPDKYKDDFDIFAEAVDAAVKSPYSITQSSYK